MVNNTLTTFLLFFFVTAIPLNAQSGSKPRPPRSLRYISENIRTIEESHDEGEFDEALESIDEMQTKLEEIAGEINSAGAGNMLKTLLSDLEEYADALKQKKPDSEEYEEARIEISMNLFKLMDSFSYRTPPLLNFLDRQFDELKEEVLEEGEWDGAGDELEEIEEFWEEIIEQYSPISGVSALADEVDKALNELEKALKRENASGIVDSVHEIHALLDQLSDLVTN